MARISGIQLLVAVIVLWAAAVWIFGAPDPHSAEPAAVPGATGAAGGGGTDAGETTSAETTTASTSSTSAPSASVDSSPAASSDSTALAERPPGPTPSADAAGATSAAPASGAAVSSAASAAGSQVASAPAPGSANPDPVAVSPVRPLPGSVAGDAAVSRIPGAGSDARGAEGAAIAPATRPQSWIEPPLSRIPPPPPSRGGVSSADAVAVEINTARRAAWEGRLGDALAHYRAAARLRPGDHVVWGEMGNVLWTMGRWAEAAYALEGAATLLVRAGELRAASELLPAVGAIDPGAAYRVQRLLQSAAQRDAG